MEKVNRLIVTVWSDFGGLGIEGTNPKAADPESCAKEDVAREMGHKREIFRQPERNGNGKKLERSKYGIPIKVEHLT